ncbi:hypothetical protein [Isoptericola aurantiacus]|uniref:hypothetical protein n=1 Tax=Isoptericola aurantiacus TaxID=3377839 RepID=UPI00383BC011
MSESEILLAGDHARSMLRSAERRGEVERLRRGAYRRVPDAGVSSTDRWSSARRRHVDRARAAHAQLRRPHWFSHDTAAVLLGLPVWRLPDPVHLTQHYRASSRAARDLRRHVLPVADHHRDLALGLPVTTLERTVADCVTTLPALDGLVIADAALRSGLDLEATRRLVESRYRGGARGSRVLELADAGAESAWESWLRYVGWWAGLPRPRTQHPVRTRLGSFRVDLGWPEHQVLVEFDGLVKYRRGALGPDHDPDAARIAEKRREDAITEATGVRLLRVTSMDARDPQSVADRLVARFPPEVRRGARRDPLLARPR